MFISPTTRQSLRRLHAAAMMDEAELLRYTPGDVDQYNMPEPGQYTYLATLPCSFRPSTGSSVSASKTGMGDSEVPLLDGQIAFNFDVEIATEVDLSNFDRVKITRLHGERLDRPLLFDLAGPALRDSLALIFPLKKVTDEEVDGG